IDAQRLVFAGPAPQPDHLARMQLADLVLDTLPYGAHTSASDALWMGVPVLTCAGRAMQARVGASLLAAAGLPHLVTTSLDAYEQRAVQLALDPAGLNDLKAALRRDRDAGRLFDTGRFCRNVEAAYEKMWALWFAGEPPRGFAV